MLRARGAGGGLPGGAGGLSGVRRWWSCSTDLGWQLQRWQEAELSLEAAAEHGRRWTELLELWRCSGSGLEGRSWPGVQRLAAAVAGRRRRRRRPQQSLKREVQPKTQNKPARKQDWHARKLKVTSITCTRAWRVLPTSGGFVGAVAGGEASGGTGGLLAQSKRAAGGPKKVRSKLEALSPSLRLSASPPLCRLPTSLSTSLQLCLFASPSMQPFLHLSALSVSSRLRPSASPTIC